MTHPRLRLAAVPLVVLPLLTAVALAPPASAAAPVFRYAGTAALTPLMATTSEAATYVPEEPSRGTAATATFKVTYHNFSPAAKASFQRAVNTWSQNVSSSVPIVIDATYKALGPGVLGSAGSNKYWLNSSTHTIAVDALANKLSGRQLDSSPDIIANFSSSFDNWYFGTGKAPKNTYDFQSVVTHELGHGLGFLGSGGVSNGKGSLGDGSGDFFGYDKAVQNTAGKKITSFADGSAALAAQLQSGKLVFTSSQVKAANGGKPAVIYAPSRWEPGSSYSHLDENTYRAGNVNSLMTPALGDGETIRTPGPIMKAIFKTIGW